MNETYELIGGVLVGNQETEEVKTDEPSLWFRNLVRMIFY